MVCPRHSFWRALQYASSWARPAWATFVRTRFAIPFDAPDGKPVSVFLGLIVPNKATERHLQLLATAAGMLSDRTFRDKLRTSTDPGTVRELLAAWPDAPAMPA
jgi:PTS system nitrogen regulatory IIA component